MFVRSIVILDSPMYSLSPLSSIAWVAVNHKNLNTLKHNKHPIKTPYSSILQGTGSVNKNSYPSHCADPRIFIV